MPKRSIVHLDADAFFAAVEQAADPKLRGKPIAASKVHDILSNPFYVGEFRISGEVYKGKHPPLVSR